jgi:hypothetical protein
VYNNAKLARVQVAAVSALLRVYFELENGIDVDYSWRVFWIKILKDSNLFYN